MTSISNKLDNLITDLYDGELYDSMRELRGRTRDQLTEQTIIPLQRTLRDLSALLRDRPYEEDDA